MSCARRLRATAPCWRPRSARCRPRSTRDAQDGSCSGDAEDLRASLGVCFGGVRRSTASSATASRGGGSMREPTSATSRRATPLCALPGDRSRVRHSGDVSIDAIVAIEPDGAGLAPTLRSLAVTRCGVRHHGGGHVPGLHRRPEPDSGGDVVAPSNGPRGRIAAWAAGSRTLSATCSCRLPVPSFRPTSWHEPPRLSRRSRALLRNGLLPGGREPWGAPRALRLPEIDFGASVALIRRDAFAS